MLTFTHLIILLVFIALGSAGISAMQEGISIVFKHSSKGVKVSNLIKKEMHTPPPSVHKQRHLFN